MCPCNIAIAREAITHFRLTQKSTSVDYITPLCSHDVPVKYPTKSHVPWVSLGQIQICLLMIQRMKLVISVILAS
jgi:hypothetical protein